MTAEQRKLFHRLCTLIADSGMKWGGRQRSATDWKVLLVSAHAAATQQEPGVVEEGLEGELVNVLLMRESTVTMPQGRASSLIDYTLSLCHTHRIAVPARPTRQQTYNEENV
jgi:hypothetical protein